MKKIWLLKLVLAGLVWGEALKVMALTAPAPILPVFDHLPLYFTSTALNRVNYPAQFVASGSDYQFLISPTEVQLNLQKADTSAQKASLRTVRMQFVGTDSQAQIRGADELPGKVNYLVGNNPAQWHTGIATFARLQVAQLYPGVRLVYHGNQRQLEYDFTVAPDANPDVIKIRFEGVNKISVDPRGELILAVGKGEIRQPAPIIYQTVNGVRKTVGGGYRLVNAHTVAFAVGQYDHKLPLVIDPILGFSTYFGGNSGDAAWSVALDTNGFVYMAGQTLSQNFYYPTNVFQTNFAGGGVTGDAFVAKMTTNGQSLIYLTYLGGNADDIAYGIAVDAAGHAYVAGKTDSTDFPVTNAIPGGASLNGTFYPEDAFVTELETNGSRLIYSTYLGGADYEAAYGIALDSSNDTYVTGITYSTNFPTTSDAYQKSFQATNGAFRIYFNANAFVSEIAAGGSNLLYSSYFGGTNYDQGNSIAVDNSNNIYVAGYTASTNFPTKNAIFQELVQTNLGTNQVVVTNFINGYWLNGSSNATPGSDVFVAKFAPSFTNLIYSTLLGGTNSDAANHIAVDSAGNAYVTGWTVSTNFPNTAANVAGLYNGLTNTSSISPFLTNAFLTQITYNGTNAAIGYSAVFGGTGTGADIGYGVAVDPDGDAFVAGSSSTANFPTYNVPGRMASVNAGQNDAFVIAFNTNCSDILYSGYLGGSGNDYGYGIAVDSQTNAYIVGQTASANFPVHNALQTSLNGAGDAFLARIDWVNEAPDITTQPTNQAVATETRVSFIVTATGTPPLHYQWQMQGTNLIWANLATTTNITSVTNATLTINPVRTNDSGSYRIIVTNYAGSVTSSVAVLTVTNVPATITTQPKDQTVTAGSTATFSVGGLATPPVFFQWLKDGIDLTNGTNASGSVIGGATNFTLTINNVQTNDAGNYQVIVTNAWGGATSSVAVLTVTYLPLITVEPTNQTVGPGSTVAFAVTAIGGSPLSYQWQFDGTNLIDGANISGSSSANLTLHNVQTNDDGGYSVIVTNSYGSVTSSPPAVLTVLTVPTFLGIAPGANGSFVFSGTGGTNNGTYIVLASTNLALALNQWTPILVNGDKFGSQGQFVFTNTPPANVPQRFYILELPPP